MKTHLAASLAFLLIATPAFAQDAESGITLPPVIVTGTIDSGALTVPGTAQAMRDIQRTPSAVEVVPDTAFKNGPAQTIRDVLGWVPGVLTQPRWSPDGRLSIRGSGLSRSSATAA